MFSFKVRSKGLFRKQLQERIQRWESVSSYKAVLTVPYEHRWWYWQEFGTASGYEAPDSLPEGIVTSDNLPGTSNPGGYGIVPKLHSGSEFLVFEVGGVTHFARSVHHPGIKPRKPVRKVLEAIVSDTRQLLRDAIAQGGSASPEPIRAAVKATGERAKQLIVQSFAVHVAGVRKPNPEHPNQVGKLEGKTAADVLQDVITVSIQKES